MEEFKLRKALSYARVFLDGKRALLYGKRRIRFDLEPHYSGFDRMLKREIVYCKFIVQEILCEARLEVKGSGDSFEIKIAEGKRPFSQNATQEPESLGDHLIKRALTPSLANGKYVLSLRRCEAEVEALQPAPGAILVRSTGVKFISREAIESKGEMLAGDLEQWLQEALKSWIGGIAGIRFDVRRDAGADAFRANLTLIRPISQIDMDLSGEDTPDVLRWQENSFFGKAEYAELMEPECQTILRENQVDIPKDAQLAGISKFEIDDDSACVALRYVHHILDASTEVEEDQSALENKGVIVVENDFWEFHIDAGKRLLIGEYRKWRGINEATAF